MDELSLLTIIGDFMPPNYASMTRDQVAQYVRAEVCNETRLKEIFWFPNKTVSDDVHSELCGLSTDQFIELGNDFVNAFSLPEFLIAVCLVHDSLALSMITGPHSAVGNVFDYRCISDCRSRRGECDPGPVPYFRGDWS